MPRLPALHDARRATLQSAVAHAFAVQPADSVGLLVDAEAYYREFYRTALQAQRSILLSGWQFDSKVELLRGREAEAAAGPVTLLSFLNWLCEQKPALQIWILAWDFHLVFAAEREWMQTLAFHWMTSERLHFRFDDNHVARGCHHQKFVVIDGGLSFLGGLDLCDHRWDNPEHRYKNPLRMSRGEPHQPFHDIQAYAGGRAVAASLQELFVHRWQRAGGEAPPPEALAPVSASVPFVPADALPLTAALVALSRTDPHGSPSGPPQCTEIRDLHVDAILAAERLIYLETQYFSSHAIADAFETRMRAQERPHLEIVMILNMEGETLKEQAAVGLAQAQILGRLREVARQTGHALGIYFTLPACDGDEQPEKGTYIHSKLMIVDDRLLSVGSANLTNRSMDVDTELNLTVCSEQPEDALELSIRRVRGALLAEHTGGDPLEKRAGLVAALDRIAERGAAQARVEPCRLRRHPSPTPKEQSALAMIDPQDLPFDPDEEDLRRGPGETLLRSLERLVRDTLGGKGIG
jgi:phosphatidylserine/phosphatidylglycerophosphate/cardiolipin synthase-like enzyme